MPATPFLCPTLKHIACYLDILQRAHIFGLTHFRKALIYKQGQTAKRGPMSDEREQNIDDDNGIGGINEGRNVAVATRTKPKTKKPSLYRVLVLNDDYTPMEFVVFNKSREDATHIMLHVHQNGVGVCGIYSYEVAETKVAQVLDLARRNQHPLQCTMEKE
jgi:ATP-dependent Clp protease adaptor protein ClpS